MTRARRRSAVAIANQAAAADIEPWTRLALAMIAAAKEAAIDGDDEAVTWIAECSWAWFAVLTGDVERAGELAWQLGRLVEESDRIGDDDAAQLIYETESVDMFQLSLFD